MKKAWMIIALSLWPGMSMGQTTFNDDAFFKSGRPWFDVMAFGAKNDGVTDDTAAIQAAITAACATNTGGVIFFPGGHTATASYLISGSATPFTISCNGLTFRGQSGQVQTFAFDLPSMIFAPNLNAPLFTTSGGLRNGLTWDSLEMVGGGAGKPNSQAINLPNANSVLIYNNAFGGWGSSAIVIGAGNTVQLYNNTVVSALLGRPTADTGAIDLSGNDHVANGNLMQCAIGTASGSIGNGHSYDWVIRSGTGFFTDNIGDLCQHGWLVTGSLNNFTANRAALNQGNGFNVTGNSNIFTGNKAFTNSQTATNSFDGFVVTGFDNIFTGNYCSTNAGNGNQQRHCFNDSNSHGSSQNIENQYSNNRGNSAGLSGVLYNMTGTAPYRIQHPLATSPDRGDASVTVQCANDASTQFFNTPLTANRTVTLSATGAWLGCKFHVLRTANATGAFNLTACGKALGSSKQWVDCEFVGGAWTETASGSL
jgi:pectate lyase-like protein